MRYLSSNVAERETRLLIDDSVSHGRMAGSVIIGKEKYKNWKWVRAFINMNL